MSPGEEAPGPGEGVRRRKLPGCPLANIQEIGVPVFLAPPRKGHPVDMIRPSARSRGGPEAGCSPCAPTMASPLLAPALSMSLPHDTVVLPLLVLDDLHGPHDQMAVQNIETLEYVMIITEANN